MEPFKMFRFVGNVCSWSNRRFKVLLSIILIIGFLIILSDLHFLKNEKLPCYDWPPHKNQERWIFTTDKCYSSSLTDKFGELWTILPISKRTRCSVLSEDLSAQVIKAIEHGARYIYVTTHLHESLQTIIARFHFYNTSSVAQYAGNYQFPLALHFYGALDKDSLNKDTSFNYRFSLRNTPQIQKLLQPFTSGEKFDHRAPPMLLAPGQSSPFTSDTILFDYGALWALTSNFGEDAQWSLIVQRLLQELDDSVLFTTMAGILASTCSEPSADVAKLQTDLKEWQCKNRTSGFFFCIVNLCDFLVVKHYLQKSDSDKIKSWLKELQDIDYKEPVLSSSKSKTSVNYVYDMIYYPPIKLTFSGLPESRFKKWCPIGLPKCPIQNSKNIQSFKPFDDLLLVLLFNRPRHYDYLDYLENLYRPHFKYIIVCGEDLPGFRKEAKRLNTTLSFFQIDKESYHEGYRNEHCLQHVLETGYDVNGYVLINDDVLVNMWNLINMPRDKVWYQQSIRPANLTQPKVPDVWRNPSWWPWQSFEGRNAIKRAIDELKLQRETNSVVHSFLNQLSKNAPGENRVFYEVCDMYYIPSILKDLYHYFISVFSRQKVFCEIAITTAICGITDRNKIHTINASYLWYGDRVKYKETFRYGTVYQHPVKYGECFKDKKCTEFICNEYLPCIAELQTL